MKLETIRLEGAGDVSLTAYLPEPSPEMGHLAHRPSMLVIPGGGYYMCSDREAEPVAMPFLQAGYAAFVLRYSVKEAAQWPNPLRDAENALIYIRSHAAQWDIDPDRVAAIGFSAGGHLAAALATLGAQRPNALVLGYPCILDEHECIRTVGAPSLDTAVTAQTPPTFIFAATNDSCVPIRHSLRFAEALADAHVPFQMHLFDRGEHGFSIGTHVVCGTPEWLENSRENRHWVEFCVDWLNRLFNFR